jgi:DUF1680 family protein
VSRDIPAPTVPASGALHPLGLDAVTIEGGFWGERQRRNAEVTLGHIERWLDRMGWLANFGGTPRAVLERGQEFSDSEVYKYLEALCWESARTGFPPALERRIGELSTRIAANQSDDGYVGTAFGGDGQPARYSDMAFGHELYCAGHLIQAAVARGRTAGLDDPLVAVARRLADHVVRTFGPDGRPAVCGHPIVEMALAELGRLTGDGRYRDQAALFVERRGHRSLPASHRGWEYFSDDLPVREARTLRGHAVRALYLASGAVDVALDTADAELMDAVAGQLRHALDRRTYVTGGMGSRHLDEAFGDDDMLPPDRAYSETCAGVASVQLAWRLLLATGRPEYGDVVERALFNVVAAGVGETGDRFFYANTLHQRVQTIEPDVDAPSLHFGGGMRAPWYDVSCCPTNVARTIASLAALLATTSDEGVQLHLYADATIEAEPPAGRVRLGVTTRYPDDGVVRIEVLEAPEEEWTLRLRVPGWSGDAILDDGAGTARAVGPGSAELRRRFRAGEVIRLVLDLSPSWIEPDPRVDAVRGCRAVRVGPRVHCLERLEGEPWAIDELRVDAAAPFGGTATSPTVRARRLAQTDAGWTLAEGGIEVPLLPYHRWANRGPSTMRVWLPLAEAAR